MKLDAILKQCTSIDDITRHLSNTVLLKYPNRDIIKDKNQVFMFLQTTYSDKALSISPYLSYYIATTDNHMIKIKTSTDKITSIYIEVNPLSTRYLFNIVYDGTFYQGFQRQPQKKTVQGDIETVLEHLTKEQVTIHPASRTDAHVHAHDQYFHADLSLKISIDKLQSLMNTMLDADIYIKSIVQVPYVFHARYDVIDKTYTYHLHHRKNPFKSKYSTYHEKITINQLEDVLKPLVGTHDFKHFSKKNTKENSIRTITQIAVYKKQENTIIEITGTGFLRHMVRMIVAQALHDYNYQTQTLLAALQQPNETTIQSFSVPACGLHLDHISYKKSSQ